MKYDSMIQTDSTDIRQSVLTNSTYVHSKCHSIHKYMWTYWLTDRLCGQTDRTDSSTPGSTSMSAKHHQYFFQETKKVAFEPHDIQTYRQYCLYRTPRTTCQCTRHMTHATHACFIRVLLNATFLAYNVASTNKRFIHYWLTVSCIHSFYRQPEVSIQVPASICSPAISVPEGGVVRWTVRGQAGT